MSSSSPVVTQRGTGVSPGSIKAIFGGAFGNFVEWYDWGIFAVLSSIFSAQIFAGGTPAVALLQTLITFAIGFAARPLGALFLSPLGDKLGRKTLLSLTIIMMGAGSLIIGITPAYSVIGIVAPVIFVLARIMQGISAGAEFQTASSFIVEHAPTKHRALFGSLTLVSSILGTMVATATGALLTATLSREDLAVWGWRVAFIFGAILSLVGLILRARAKESPAFEAMAKENAIEKAPIRTVFARHKLAMLRMFAISIYTSPYYLFTVYLPTYAHLTSGIPLDQAFLGGIIALIIMMIALPLVGALSDRIGRKPMLLATPIGIALLIYPFLNFLESPDFGTFLLVDIVGCLVISFTSGTMSAAYCELFPADVRSTGIGIPYNISSALLGGTTPLIATAMTTAGNGIGLVWLFVPLALFSIIVLAFMPEVRGRDLHQRVTVGSEA